MGVFSLTSPYLIVTLEGERPLYLLGWNWCTSWSTYRAGTKLPLYTFGLKGLLSSNKSVHDIDESHCVPDDVGCHANPPQENYFLDELLAQVGRLPAALALYCVFINDFDRCHFELFIHFFAI